MKGYNTLLVTKPNKEKKKRLAASYKAGTKKIFLQFRNFGILNSNFS